jgi:hypothetical protein
MEVGMQQHGTGHGHDGLDRTFGHSVLVVCADASETLVLV